MAEAFNIELAQVVKFFIFLIVLVFDPLAVALIIAFNGLITDKKRKQREAIIEMMKGDEELGLYEVYGDKKEDLMENNSQNIEDDGKNSDTLEDSEIIMENNLNFDEVLDGGEINEEPIGNLKWETYMHPEFPWHNRKLWINNPKAVNYWISNKGGTPKELSKLRKEEENIKTY